MTRAEIAAAQKLAHEYWETYVLPFRIVPIYDNEEECWMDLNYWTLVPATIGAVSGLSALAWRVIDYIVSYLYIELHVDLRDGNFLTAMTVVENRKSGKRGLDRAALLVGPESEDPRDTMQQMGICVKSANCIVEYSKEAKCGPGGRCLIPLPFYYSENIAIADEKVSYRMPIETQNIERGVPYSVRFFVRRPRRLHRTTHDCFLLPKAT